jgi:hypothetical protein
MDNNLVVKKRFLNILYIKEYTYSFELKIRIIITFASRPQGVSVDTDFVSDKKYMTK